MDCLRDKMTFRVWPIGIRQNLIRNFQNCCRRNRDGQDK